MNGSPTQFHAKLNNLLAAWAEFAPESKFAGMNLAEFKTAIARSVDSRSQLDSLRLQIKGILAQRSAGDAEAKLLVTRVVGGVIADGAYGPDSALYRALNYVPRSERASGLTQKTASASTASVAHASGTSATTSTNTTAIASSAAPSTK